MAKQDIKLVPTVTTYSTQASVLVVEGSQLVRVPIGLLGTTGGVVPPDLSTLVTQVSTLETSLTSKVGTNDVRLTDTRVPKGSAGGSLAGVYPNPTLASTGVLPGNYQNPTLTISADGRVTSASSGTSGGTIDAYTKLETDVLLSPLSDDIDNHSQRLDVLEPLVGANTSTNSIIATDLANKVNTWDSRLGDSRTPKGTAGGVLAGSYPNPELANSGVTPGIYPYPILTISADGRVTKATNNPPVIPDTYTKLQTDGLLSSRDTIIGTNAQSIITLNTQVASNTDSISVLNTGLSEKVNNTDTRLSDSRNTKGSAGGDLVGNYPNPTLKPTGVTAGTYQYATVSIDTSGRVISASSNTPTGNLGVVLIAISSARNTYSGSAFTTVKLGATYDYLSKFDAATFTYLVPVTGLYLCNSKIRIKDDSGSFSYGQGVHIANTDNASFLWTSSISGFGVQSRNGCLNSRVGLFNAGDRLRLFMYAGFNGTCDVDAAELVIVHMGSQS